MDCSYYTDEASMQVIDQELCVAYPFVNKCSLRLFLAEKEQGHEDLLTMLVEVRSKINTKN